MILFWHRRDLRIDDNAGLYKALKSGEPVQPIFIFDKNILDELPESDQRVLFIYRQIEAIKKAYQEFGSDLIVYYSTPTEVFSRIKSEFPELKGVVTNRDYEPYAKERDKAVFEILLNQGVEFFGAKDHVIFEKEEVVKDDGTPYKVYTPYSKRWKEKLSDFYLKPYPCEKYWHNLIQHHDKQPLIALAEMGFSNDKLHDFPDAQPNLDVIKNYDKTRDIPSIKGTTRMSLHLRFGTISIRKLARLALKNEKYLNELIWRDFYQMIIHHFPESDKKAFKPQYDLVEWRKDEAHFQAWCEGKTGYPIVDAGMRELNATGFMHNRVRMIVASFLTKHLLLDWRWGEAYFAEKLLDFELASNVGGWQWAAGCGVDAQPYFRVFNPMSQQEKFDPQWKYIKQWVPEFGTASYPKPIVEHKMARERAIETFKKALN
jgi:deoxyribodipyrimidine photo-lyase